MAPNTDTDRLALCEPDTIRLAKMGEELDAAAEYIGILSDQILGAQEQPAVSRIDPLERADRGALLQVVYNLEKDNPQMSLTDALVYISGAFGGEGDAPLLDPVQTVPAFAPYEEEAEELDSAGMAPDDASLNDPQEENPAHEEEPAEPDFTQQWTPKTTMALTPPEDDAWTDASSADDDFTFDASPAFEETSSLPDFEELTGLSEQENSSGLPDFETITGLPEPVSASAALGDPPLPAGPDDEDWDPSKWVPKPDPDKELQKLLEEVQTPRDELYGIKAYAAQHPELFDDFKTPTEKKQKKN